MTTTGDEMLEAAHGISRELVADRRTIHEKPELAYEETQTALMVAGRLRELGIETWDPLESTCRHASLSIL